MTTFLFVLRRLGWWLPLALIFMIITVEGLRFSEAWMFLFVLVVGANVAVGAFSHLRRVRLVADGEVDAEALGSRHKRQVEIPFPAEEAFDLVEAAVRELPSVESVQAARDSLQVRARVLRKDPYDHGEPARRKRRARANLVLATITPGDRTSSLALVCEPEGEAWVDWYKVDQGTNLENAQAVLRAITRRVSERRKGEEATARETATQKELTVAKLSLLHAQVEPHFLYNSLASAQVLTRSDPERADRMLGHLITYLRHSLPRTEASFSTLGEELERARAYLEILRIRMGERLGLEIQVPEALLATPLPPMMLQTLVENAIKHGLEPQPAGGTVWILAREQAGKVAVTVADDGRGFGEGSAGTGIGLRNVRERLRLAYAEAASFSIASNFPRGVAATITVPGGGPGGAHA
jgi:signal transduction histidine kinase